MKKVICFFIQCYQWTISPLLGNCCRFYPTCSEYAKESIQKHGVCKGIFRSCKRICKCHPFHPGGYDPVD
ncbi:MAG: membrane protein insertion efficiency factor YidD [Chlamydiota bacterium]